MHLPLALALLASSLGPGEQEKLFAQLDRCIEAAHKVVEEAPRYDPACSPAVQRLVAGGVPDSRLWQAYDALPSYAALRRSIVHYLFERRVEQALMSVPKPRRSPEVVASDEPLEELVVQARAFHKALAEPVTERLRSARESLGERNQLMESEAFDATLAAFVRGKLSLEAAETAIARYVSGTCLVPDGLGDVQLSLVFLKALADRRWRVAAGALGDSPYRGYPKWSQEARDAKRRLLGLAGVDWELHEVGAALWGDPSAAQSLGEQGSERAARLLITALESAPVDPDAAAAPRSLHRVLHLLAAFVTPQKGCESRGSYFGLNDVFRVSATPASEATQEQILHLLARYAGPDRGEADSETASNLLARLCRVESRDAFRSMLNSPFSTVRKRGFGGLRALGDDPVPLADPKPVQFEITVDGRPFASPMMRWEVKGPRVPYSPRSSTSDDRGNFTIDRDAFADPTTRVEEIVVGATLKEPVDAWFRVHVPRPTSLDRVIAVTADTQRLTVRLAENADPASAAVIRMILFSKGPDGIPEWVTSQSLSGEEPIVFERLQTGRRYYVRAHDSASRAWTSDEVLLGSTPAVLVVRPE